MGTSHLMWDGEALLASRLGATRFNPPIPILISGAKEVTQQTATSVEYLGRKVLARTVLTQSEEKIVLNGESLTTIRAVLSVQMPSDDISLVSHYVLGFGLVRQRQETNGKFDVSLELLGEAKR